MSTRKKLIILLFASLFGIIVLFSGFIYYNLIQYSYVDFHGRLHTRAITTAKIEIDESENPDFLKEFKSEFLEKLTNENHFISRIDTLDTHSYSQKIGIPESFIKNTIKDGDHFYKKDNTFYNAIIHPTKNGDYLVIVSAENYYHTHHEVYLRQLMIGTIVFAVLLIFFLSYWISNRISNPLKKISARVNEIGMDNLHMRLPENGLSSELEILSKSFNVMLDRLETAFEAQNNFISNASHELRTPLTSIMAEADLALSREREVQSYKETLKVISIEADKLNDKTKALLYLAQTAFKKSKLTFSTLSIDEVLLDCKSTFNKINPENKIQIDLSDLPDHQEQLLINGNKQLLLLALSNIIGNAIKYSNNGIVWVKPSWTKENIVISVIDKGIGIPEQDLPYIFDPFYRATNSYDFEGYGIGLPLSRNIIRLHKGELHIFSSKNQGTEVKIKIPLGAN